MLTTCNVKPQPTFANSPRTARTDIRCSPSVPQTCFLNLRVKDIACNLPAKGRWTVAWYHTCQSRRNPNNHSAGSTQPPTLRETERQTDRQWLLHHRVARRRTRKSRRHRRRQCQRSQCPVCPRRSKRHRDCRCRSSSSFPDSSGRNGLELRATAESRHCQISTHTTQQGNSAS